MDKFDEIVEILERRQKNQEDKIEQVSKQILATKEWLPIDIQNYLGKIAIDLNKSSDEIFINIVQNALGTMHHPNDPKLHVYVGISFSELLIRFKPYFVKDKFLEFAKEHFTKDKLEDYRKSHINGLRWIWKQRLSERAKHLVEKLEGEYGIEHYPEEKELVKVAALSPKEFKKYEGEILIPRLIELCGEFSKGLSRTKRWKIEAANFLKSKYPRKHLNPARLWELERKCRSEGALYLRQKYGEDPKVGDRIKEVFRKPNKRR